MLTRIIVSLGVIFSVFLSGMTCVHAADTPPSLTLSPDHVEIDFFYGGQGITVNGLVPSGQDCVVRITGGGQPLHLKKKGKVWGFLWMNVKSLSYEDVPVLYVIRSSNALSDMSSPTTFGDLTIGYDALKTKLAPDPQSDESLLFGEMVKLKEHEGLFSVTEGTITRTPGENGMDRIEAQVNFPSKAPVGDYTAELLVFTNGELTATGTRTISLERSPSVKLLSSLAVNNGLLYGCIAVFIALASGLLTGVIFGMSGKAH